MVQKQKSERQDERKASGEEESEWAHKRNIWTDQGCPGGREDCIALHLPCIRSESSSAMGY